MINLWKSSVFSHGLDAGKVLCKCIEYTAGCILHFLNIFFNLATIHFFLENENDILMNSLIEIFLNNIICTFYIFIAFII